MDEISERNHRLVSLAGWYKNEPVLNTELYDADTAGTLPGEGAAMFVVNNKKENATAKLCAIKMVSGFSETEVKNQLLLFLKENLQEGETVDLFLQGENGDNRLLKYYTECESIFDEKTTTGRFKHLTGEFQTVPAVALWMACHFLQTQNLPHHTVKKKGNGNSTERILIYNNYQGAQHGFMLVEKV